MKIRPVGAELFGADGRTDRRFVNAPENESLNCRQNSKQHQQTSGC